MIREARAQVAGRIALNSAGAIVLMLAAVAAGGAYWVESRKSPVFPTIALIPQTAGALVWDVEHLGARDAASKLRYHIYWNAPTSENDVAGQVSLIDKVSRGNYTGMVLAPIQPLAILSPVRRVLAAGIPVAVVSAELELPAGGKLVYIVNDEERMGELAAAELARSMRGRGEIALAGIGRNAPGVVRRARSAERYLASRFPDIRVVSRVGWSYNSSRLEEVVNATRDEHPKLKGVLSFTAVATRGVRAALKNRPPSEPIAVVGCEQDSDVIEAVRAGEIAGIVAEDSYRMGFEGVEALAALRAGKTVASSRTVTPVLITRQNVDSEETRRLMKANR